MTTPGVTKTDEGGSLTVTDYSYAVNVWNIDPSGKTDTEIAEAGLVEMRKWMQEMHLVLSLKELGVTESMLEGIAEGTFILNGGYKVLTKAEIVRILKESL